MIDLDEMRCPGNFWSPECQRIKPGAKQDDLRNAAIQRDLETIFCEPVAKCEVRGNTTKRGRTASLQPRTKLLGIFVADELQGLCVFVNPGPIEQVKMRSPHCCCRYRRPARSPRLH